MNMCFERRCKLKIMEEREKIEDGGRERKGREIKDRSEKEKKERW